MSHSSLDKPPHSHRRPEAQVRAAMEMRERAAALCDRMGYQRCAGAIRALPLEGKLSESTPGALR